MGASSFNVGIAARAGGVTGSLGGSMFQSVTNHLRKGLVGSFAALFCSAVGAEWQRRRPDQVVLNQSGSQVTDTTIRSGAYANTNFDGQPLITRRSSDPDWERRTLIKFDTENSVPAGRPDRVRDADADRQVGPGFFWGNTAYPGVAGHDWIPGGGCDLASAHELVHLVDPRRRRRRGGRDRQRQQRRRREGGLDLTAVVQRAVDGDFDNRATRACSSMTRRARPRKAIGSTTRRKTARSAAGRR